MGAVLAWQHHGGKRKGGECGGVTNVERVPGLPRPGLFWLSRATDEAQMDGQLLCVSGPREAGVTKAKL